MDLNALGGVDASTGKVTATTLTGTVTGDVKLTKTTNAIDKVGAFTVTTGDFTLVDANSVDVTGALAAVNISLTSSKNNGALTVSGSATATGATGVKLVQSDNKGTIAITGTVSATAGTLDVSSGAGLDASAGTVSTKLLTGTVATSSAGDAKINKAAVNAIDGVGAFSVANGDFLLESKNALTVSGALSATNVSVKDTAAGVGITVSGTGSITTTAGKTATLNASTGAIALAGNVNATSTGVVDLSAASGGVDQTAGVITAGTLKSTGGLTGDVKLTSSGVNAISALAALTVTTGDFRLLNGTALDLTNALTANNVFIRDSAAGGITVSNTVKAASAGGTVSLAANRIVFAGAGKVDANTGTAEFGPHDTTAAVVLGGSAAAGINLQTADFANITAGTVRVGTAAAGGGTKGTNVSITGDVTVAGTLDVQGSGSFSNSGKTLTVGTLTGNIGKADMSIGTNKISKLGDFTTTTGAFGLKQDAATALQVTGAVATTGNKLLTIAADTFTIAGGTLNAGTGTIEIGVVTGTTTLTVGGAAGSGVEVGNLSAFTAGTIQLGKSSVGTVSAKQIDITDNATTTATLNFQATGAVTQTAGTLSAATIMGSAASFDIQKANNKIATVGTTTATTGDFLLVVDKSAVDVTGTLTATLGNVSIKDNASGTAITVSGSVVTSAASKTITLDASTAGALSLTGSVNAQTTGTIDLSAKSGGIGQSGGSTLTAKQLKSSNGITGDVALSGTGNKISELGAMTVTAGNLSFVQAAATPLSIEGAVVVDNGKSIALATDTFSFGAAGALNAGATGTVAVAPVTASTVVTIGTPVGSGIDAGDLSKFTAGTIRLGQNVAATSSQASAINLTGNATTTATLSLSTSGAVTQTGGTLSAAVLTTGASGKGSIASADIQKAGNVISALDVISVTTGDFLLTQKAASALQVTGAVSVASGKNIRLGTDLFSFGASGALSAGTTGLVEIGPITSTTVVTIGTTPGTGIEPGDLSKITAGTIRLGQSTAGGSVKAASIALTGNATQTTGAGGLDLITSGAVTQTGGTLTATGLSFTVGSLSLTQTGNKITSATGTAGTDVTINDDAALTVAAGGITATAGSVKITDNASGTAITLTGAINATAASQAITLNATAGSITLNANAATDATTGTVDLSAAAGGISQTGGVITAGTLKSTSNVTGNVALTKNNAVAKIGDFKTAGDFNLMDVTAVDIVGTLSASGAITVTDPAGGTAITVTKTVQSTGASKTVTLDAFSAGAISVGAAGLVDANTTGSTSLKALNGITNSGTITAATNTLTSGSFVQNDKQITGTTSNSISGNSVVNTGTIKGGTNGLTANSALIDNSGTIDGSANTLTAKTSITNSGLITGGGTDTLDATTKIINTATGVITDTTANLTAKTGISFDGKLTSTGTATLTTTTGGISQTGGTLSAATLDLNVLTSGGVTQSVGATITATTLQSSSGVKGDVSLLSTTNAIKAISGFSTTGKFSLQDSVAVDVTGVLVATDDVSITDSAGATAITVTNTVQSTGASKTVTLDASAAGAISIGSKGQVDANTTGSTSIKALSGITNAGTITAATNVLAGGSFIQNDKQITGTTANTLGAGTITNAGTVTGGTNGLTASTTLISNTGTIDGSANTLTATTSISNAGTIKATGTDTLKAGTTLTNTSTGSISDTTANLTAGTGISLDGSVVATGTATLVTTTGGISQSGGTLSGATLDLSVLTSGGITQSGGKMVATTLQSGSGVIGDVAAGTSTTNNIAKIGDFTTNGDFTLKDATAVDVTGVLKATGALTLTDTGSGITISKTVQSTGASKTVTLDASAAGTISIGATGLVDANTTGSTSISADGGITNNGTITAASNTLVGGAFTKNNSQITGKTSNTISGLSVANSGTIDGGTNNITAAADLTNSGLITGGGTDTLKGGNITNTTTGVITDTTANLTAKVGISNSGTITSTGTATLTTDTGGITQSAGTISAATLDLNVTTSGGVTQSGGAITATTLQSTSGVTGDVALTAGTNAIGKIATFKVTGGDFSLKDTVAVDVTGVLTAVNTTITDTAAGTAITVSGTMTTTGTNKLVGTAGGIKLSGTIDAGAGTFDTSAAAGGVSQTAGTITAGTLTSTGNVTGNTVLTSATNKIATVGTFAVKTGDFTLVDAVAVTVTGALSAVNATITDTAAGTAIGITGSTIVTNNLTLITQGLGGGQNIGITGIVTAPNTLTTTANGSILRTGSAAFTVGKLTGSAIGSARFGETFAGDGQVNVNTLGKFTVTGSGSTLALDNAKELDITGPIAADFLRITATGKMTVSGDIATLGQTRAEQNLLNDTDVQNLNVITKTALTAGSTGSYLQVKQGNGGASFVQNGTTKLTSTTGGLATLRIDMADPGGSAALNNLEGPGTDLILFMRGGTATGNVTLNGLTIIGTGGNSDLFGALGGLTGSAAAGKAKIGPQPGAKYQFNSCPVGSVNCVLSPINTVPQNNPLTNIVIGGTRPPTDDLDLILPNVSDEDY